jgi:probable H4MPT-linked C1 transfer pathway protein
MPVSREDCLGWDLGGAHIKAVKLDGVGNLLAVVLIPCPLWQGLERLQAAIDQVFAGGLTPPTRHAVTMTGEMVDLFPDRARGVETLVGVMRSRFPDAELMIYGGRRGLLWPDDALRDVNAVASANWLASASFTATRLPEGLFVDVGSTTADLVPFKGGRVVALGYADHQRLELEELVYSGVTRTPLMALAQDVAFAGKRVALVAENFATTADVYRLTGDLPEHADLFPSPDNGSKDAAASSRRVARMLGLDSGVGGLDVWRHVARQFAERQLRTLADACERILSRGVLSAGAPLVAAGVGRFLIARLAERLERPCIAFNDFFGPQRGAGPNVADCAAAAAVAYLAVERASPS